MRNTDAALEWIVEKLEKLQIPFEIDGGFAAMLYGAKRDLADIDINIPLKDFHRLVPFVIEHITFGPTQYKDDSWDLLMFSMKYAGQTIDISALERTKYYDRQSNQWLAFPADLSNVRLFEYHGLTLPVINEIKLMLYKSQLDRGVDRKDVRDMEDSLLKN